MGEMKSSRNVAHEFNIRPARTPRLAAKAIIDSAVEAVGRADAAISTLQDSMLPVEVGDAELRAGLQDVRRLLGNLRGPARELVRTLGR